ncbi:XXYS1_4_G0047040.mRNA.1.CDS.1 [Saccharomyces cerevisiae]|nr:XXYS1_4_G0047040.mRNA.1.CDS.1 [Saccharomyces cerevisiae]
MSSVNQIYDLFPNKHNIQFTDSHSQEHDTSSSIAKNDTDGTISIPGSVDTGILKSIIEEQGWNDAELYRSSIQNQRFFLTDKYTKKKHLTMEDMLSPEEEQIYQEPIQDFQTYNKRVQREYELRERMEEFFRQNTKNDLHILNEDSLNQQYSPLGPADYVLPLDRYSRMKHIASNFFRKKLGIPGKLKRRSHYNPNAEGHTKGNSSILSSTTDIIDNASYRNIAIDENVDITHKEHAIDEINEQGASGGESVVEGGSLLHDIEKVFNRSRATRKYHIQRKLKVRHIQMLSIGACFSVGLFLTSGKAFSIAGPFGMEMTFTKESVLDIGIALNLSEI